MDYSIIVIVIQLVFLEGILSIDNAAVLGAMVVPLPNDKQIPWPPILEKFGRWLHPVLGYQRSAALKVGLLGAYVGRGLMLLLASVLIENLWIRLIGAIYLIHLACHELGDSTPHDQTTEEKKEAAQVFSFWHVVFTIELMDLVFSIDNVIAAVAISKELWVVMLGVAIGILTMRFAAGLFSYAVEREPILKEAAYILILNIGVQLILEEIWKIEFSDLVRFGISIFIILACLFYAHSPLLQKLNFILRWLSWGLGILNDFMEWLVYPITSLFRKLFQ